MNSKVTMVLPLTGLHHVSKIKEKKHHPNGGKETLRVTKLPTHANMKTTEIHTQLLDEANKQADSVRLISSQKTTDEYSNGWIYVYIDASAQNATYDAEYGAYIQFPYGTYDKLFDAPGTV